MRGQAGASAFARAFEDERTRRRGIAVAFDGSRCLKEQG
jgi:hypothetical protein